MAEPEAPNGANNYVLLNQDGTDGESVFTGRQPRQAALKVARVLGGTKEKPVEIKLRERGVHDKAHVFKAWKETVPAPKNKPAWMKDIITKGNVEKVGTEELKAAGQAAQGAKA